MFQLIVTKALHTLIDDMEQFKRKLFEVEKYKVQLAHAKLAKVNKVLWNHIYFIDDLFK